MLRELRGKLGEETSEKLINFIQDSQQRRFEERWDQLVTKDILQQEFAKVRAELGIQLVEYRSEYRDDLDKIRSEIHKEVNGLRSEIATSRSETHKEVNGLRSEIATSRSETHKEIDGLRTEMTSFRSDIHKELRAQLRWLLPLLFGQLGLLLAMMVKIFTDG